MRPHRNLAVLHASELLVQGVLALSSQRPLLFRAQLEHSAQAVSANIGEAFGRQTTADRNRVLVIARAEAEETIQHLRANFKRGRVEPTAYWRLHNLLVTIVKMINMLMRW